MVTQKACLCVSRTKLLVRPLTLFDVFARWHERMSMRLRTVCLLGLVVAAAAADIHAAVGEDSPTMIREAIEAGESVNAIGQGGQSPLMAATLQGKVGYSPVAWAAIPDLSPCRLSSLTADRSPLTAACAHCSPLTAHLTR